MEEVFIALEKALWWSLLALAALAWGMLDHPLTSATSFQSPCRRLHQQPEDRLS